MSRHISYANCTVFKSTSKLSKNRKKFRIDFFFETVKMAISMEISICFVFLIFLTEKEEEE